MLKRKWSEINETNETSKLNTNQKKKPLTILDLLPIIYCKQPKSIPIIVIPQLEAKWQYCFDSLAQVNINQVYFNHVTAHFIKQPQSHFYEMWRYLFQNHANQVYIVHLLDYCFAYPQFQKYSIEMIYTLVEIQNQKYVLNYMKTQYFPFLRSLFYGVVDVNLISLIQEYLVGTFRIQKETKIDNSKYDLNCFVNFQLLHFHASYDSHTSELKLKIKTSPDKHYKLLTFGMIYPHDIVFFICKHIQDILLYGTFIRTWLFHLDSIFDKIIDYFQLDRNFYNEYQEDEDEDQYQEDEDA
jgi:hypothetical protein